MVVVVVVVVVVVINGFLVGVRILSFKIEFGVVIVFFKFCLEVIFFFGCGV